MVSLWRGAQHPKRDGRGHRSCASPTAVGKTNGRGRFSGCCPRPSDFTITRRLWGAPRAGNAESIARHDGRCDHGTDTIENRCAIHTHNLLQNSQDSCLAQTVYHGAIPFVNTFGPPVANWAVSPPESGRCSGPIPGYLPPHPGRDKGSAPAVRGGARRPAGCPG